MSSDQESTNPSLLQHVRPTRPDPEILDEAGRGLLEFQDLQRILSWRLLERTERPGSTLFRLLATHDAGQTMVYYKTEHARPDFAPNFSKALRVFARARRALKVEAQLAATLGRRLGTEGMTFDRPLCVRPDRLTAVRLAVPGRQLGRPVALALPGRRRRGLETYRKIGRAGRIIEEVSRSLGPPLAPDAIVSRSDSILRASFGKIPLDLHEASERAVEDLLSRIHLETASIWGHGDLSSSNLIMDDDLLGIIDFSWRAQIPGESIAYFASRLAGASWTPTGWNRAVMDAVLVGYRASATDDSWKLAWLLRLLRGTTKTKVVRDWSATRLQEEVRAAEEFQ